jgi:hypothetical protein
MTVEEIIKKYLVDNGFDGLCTNECGCFTDNLILCGGYNPAFSECVPGHAYVMNQGDTCEGCADKCPFSDIDGGVSEYGWICSLEDLPVKCRKKKETGNA